MIYMNSSSEKTLSEYFSFSITSFNHTNLYFKQIQIISKINLECFQIERQEIQYKILSQRFPLPFVAQQGTSYGRVEPW